MKTSTRSPLRLKKLSGRVLTTEQLRDINGGFVLTPRPDETNSTCQASCSSCNSCVWWTCGDWSCAGTHCFC